MDSALATIEAHTLTQPDAPNKGKRHLKPHEVADALRWHVQGLTQEQIAARFDPPKDQSTISRIIAKFGQDNTQEAKRILKGGSVRMALSVVEKGSPKDHVNALKGLGVLEEQQQSGLTVIVGGGSQVTIGVLLSPPTIELQGEGQQKG